MLTQAQKEYHSKEAPEARLVKAIDELQAFLWMLVSNTHDRMNRDLHNPDSIAGYRYAKEFPLLLELLTLSARLVRRRVYVSKRKGTWYHFYRRLRRILIRAAASVYQ